MTLPPSATASHRASTLRLVIRPVAWAVATTLVLSVLIVLGSRNLAHFDAALVGYTFSVLFATFGLTYRYAMWLQRPPTALYWKRGWQAFVRPGRRWRNIGTWLRRVGEDVLANRFILARGRLRGLTHLLIMWGCLLAVAITFPGGSARRRGVCHRGGGVDRRSSRMVRAQRIPIVNAILAFVILIVILQLWLLTATMNAYLGGDSSTVIPAALGSLACLALNAGLARYLLGFDW